MKITKISNFMRQNEFLNLTIKLLNNSTSIDTELFDYIQLSDNYKEYIKTFTVMNYMIYVNNIISKNNNKY